MTQPVIVAAKRTPIGRFMGGLSRIPSPKLGAVAIAAVLDEVPAARDQIDECIMGCVLQAGLGQNPARQAGLGAGLSDELNAMTVNKVCGSGLQSVMLAAQSIKAGDNELVLAGGFESMSLAPHYQYLRSGVKYGDGAMIDHMAHDGLSCPFEGWAMGHAADHTAAKHGITREDQDRFAARSHHLAAAARRECFFKAETVPVSAEQAKQKEDVTVDEGIREDTSVEKLARLKPVFDSDGTVTAGNASQISDGAAALLVATEEKAKTLGVEPLARIVDYYTSGVAPKDIFEAPAKGMKAILERNGLGVDDVDLVELNEAFAAQVLANIREVDVPEDKLNICGGGIALGHPIGASGGRVLTTLVHQMIRTGARRGLASLCLGGGNSVSMLIER